MAHVYAPDLVEKRWQGRTKERDEYLRDNKGIDAALLAVDLNVSERFVWRYQQKLGIRPMANTPRKGKANETSVLRV